PTPISPPSLHDALPIYLAREAELTMLVGREPAHGDHRIDMRNFALQEAGVPPELRRTSVAQAAPDALAAGAQLPVVTPQDVHGRSEEHTSELQSRENLV